jgi:hypothetical protein
MKVSIKAAASALGYLVILPDTPQEVSDTFRRWCKEHTQPYLWIETRGRQQAALRAPTKTVFAREASAVLARFREQLPQLSTPYVAPVQAWATRQACPGSPGGRSRSRGY